jgi:hypothetical protein
VTKKSARMKADMKAMTGTSSHRVSIGKRHETQATL